jgi:hypothetical protein
MDEVMNELKESIQEVETYLKHLKDTYAEWIQLNSVSFRPTYKKKKPIKRIRIIKPYNIVITHHKELIKEKLKHSEPTIILEFERSVSSLSKRQSIYKIVIKDNGEIRICRKDKFIPFDRTYSEYKEILLISDNIPIPNYMIKMIETMFSIELSLVKRQDTIFQDIGNMIESIKVFKEEYKKEFIK